MAPNAPSERKEAAARWIAWQGLPVSPSPILQQFLSCDGVGTIPDPDNVIFGPEAVALLCDLDFPFPDGDPSDVLRGATRLTFKEFLCCFRCVT